jgi:hypothetical protein
LKKGPARDNDSPQGNAAPHPQITEHLYKGELWKLPKPLVASWEQFQKRAHENTPIQQAMVKAHAAGLHDIYDKLKRFQELFPTILETLWEMREQIPWNPRKSSRAKEESTIYPKIVMGRSTKWEWLPIL